MFRKWLFTRIDNSALIVFRIVFGMLLALEAFGSLMSGWVHHIFIIPEFTFSFIGFGFLQPLPGPAMVGYFILLGVLGLFVMLGFRYRMSMLLYTLMWTGVYLMQKSSYNNHYYLLMLLCFIMIFLPAQHYASFDTKYGRVKEQIWMPRWVWGVLVFQLWIVYTYAAIAKIYPDWFNGRFAQILMADKADYILVGNFLQQDWIPYAIAYFGFFFDLLIIPFLLWRRTRVFAFVFAVFFHLFNSFVFHIGIFPYLALAFTLFFFPSEKINKLFLPQKPHYYGSDISVPNNCQLFLSLFSLWFLVQLTLPLRHWLIKDDVLWTEEGHRLSWRMMLRSKRGVVQFKVVDRNNPMDTIRVNNREYLTATQRRAIPGKPDLIWQFAQHLEKIYDEQGVDARVFVDSKISVNGRPYKTFVDPKVDLAAEEWNHLKHSAWILPSSLD